jgi:hypothetical protein
MEDTKTTALSAAHVSHSVPAFIADHDGEDTLSTVKQHVILPRVKVVQPLSKEPFKPRFKEGDVVATPVMLPLALDKKPGDLLFHFVPIFFYAEYITWNPRSAGMVAIRDRSIDPTSRIAIKSRDPKQRVENCPDAPLKNGKPQEMKHLEHLNYVFMVVDPEHELFNFPLTLSFASGEHKAGSNFNTLLTMRRVKFMYACQFAAKLAKRTNEKGEWFGIDIDNPAEASGVTPFIQDEARFQQLAEFYKTFKGYYEQRLLEVDMADLEAADEAGAARDEKDF